MNAAEKNPMLMMSTKTLEKKIADAIAAECERCAKICDGVGVEYHSANADECAYRIRSDKYRGNKT